METVNEQGIENLIFAIVTQVIIDYEKALQHIELTRGPGGLAHEIAKSKALKIEKFFESEFCYLMTQVDGDQIIYACKQRVKDPNYKPDGRFRPHSNSKRILK